MRLSCPPARSRSPTPVGVARLEMYTFVRVVSRASSRVAVIMKVFKCYTNQSH